MPCLGQPCKCSRSGIRDIQQVTTERDDRRDHQSNGRQQGRDDRSECCQDGADAGDNRRHNPKRSTHTRDQCSQCKQRRTGSRNPRGNLEDRDDQGFVLTDPFHNRRDDVRRRLHQFRQQRSKSPADRIDTRLEHSPQLIEGITEGRCGLSILGAHDNAKVACFLPKRLDAGRSILHHW